MADKKEASSVEETIKGAKGIDPGAELGLAPVQSTTKETPSKADESSAPGSNMLCPFCGATVRKPTFSLIPQRSTIPRARRVTCWMSDSAPVVASPKTSSSATRPPTDTRIFARSSLSE